MNHLFFLHTTSYLFLFSDRVVDMYYIVICYSWEVCTFSKTSFFSNQKIRNRKICNSNLFAMSVFVVVYEFLNNSLINSDNQRERIAYHHSRVDFHVKKCRLRNFLLILVPNDLDNVGECESVWNKMAIFLPC